MMMMTCTSLRCKRVFHGPFIHTICLWTYLATLVLSVYSGLGTKWVSIRRSDWMIANERHFGFSYLFLVLQPVNKNVYGQIVWFVVVLFVMATRSVFVLATVVSIRDKFCYPCCTQCHKKVHTREDEITFWCEGCRKVYSAASVQYRYRISVMASDRTHIAQITVFGSCLDRFFGTSATSFMRFVNSVKYDTFSAIPWTRVVYQAMGQCFVGALLQFGFRIYSSYRTASQISRNSPFHLKNIVNKQRKSENTRCQPEQFPSLLACQILPSSPTDQSPTVLRILNEYLQELHPSTPQSFNVRSSQGSPSQDGVQYQASYEAFLAARRASLHEKRTSSILCTPQELGSMNTPLDLTSSSQSSSCSVLTQENATQSDSKDRKKFAHLYSQDACDSSSFSNEQKSQFPVVIQLVSPTNLNSGGLKTNTHEEEEHFSHVWTEYDDFPSSEDLSAFLANLEREEGREDERTPPTPQYEICHDRPTSVTLHEKTTEITTLKDVCEMSRTSKADNFTEFTDFPSSEDLDAFLADMELDCEHIPMVKSLTSKTTVASAAFLNSKSNCQAVGSRHLVGKDHLVEDIVDTDCSNPSSEFYEDNKETDESSCDMGVGIDSCWARKKAKPTSTVSCSAYLDKTAYDSHCDSSDSQFLRDCESVFSKLTESVCHEDRAGSKPNCNLLKNVLLSNQRRYISRNFGGEFHEKDFVCATPVRDSRTSVIRSRVRNVNETQEGQLQNQSNAERLTSIDHHDNNDVSMLDSCENMAVAPASPDIFSQSLSLVESCSKTPDLFSSPRLVNGEFSSRCTEYSTTPDLFPSPRHVDVDTRSSIKEELNSVSLFSSSECSHFSSVSSPLTRAEQQASLPSPTHLAVRENEAASPNVGDCDVKNRLDRNSVPLSFHSTPYYASIPSKMLSRIRTPIQVSPLLASTDQCYDISLQGTPVLFSQLSNSSF